MPSQKNSQIEKTFVGAVDFLKTLRVKNQQPILRNTPWYMAVGPANSGKSTLLSHSGLKFILAKYNHQQANQHSKQKIKRTRGCDWWVTQQAVILDFAGRMISVKDNQTQRDWQQLLRLTKTHLPAKNFSGVIVVVSLEEMMSLSTEENRQQNMQLQERIGQIKKIYGPTTPVTLVVNKLDLLKGFVEYFADLDQANREQQWGFAFGKDECNRSIYNEKFTVLLNHLHERLIWRLHHERNASKRSLLKQFPLQFESIKPLLADYIDSDLANEPSGFYPLQGIYFTSSIQEGIPIDRLLQPLTKTLEGQALIPKTALGTFKENKSYFIKQLFQTVFSPQQSAIPTKPQKSLLRPLFYAVSVMLLVVCATAWTIGFKQRLTQINSAQNAITAYQLLSQQFNINQASLAQTLPSLDALHNGLLALHKINRKKWWVIGLPQNKKLFELLDKTYKKALKSVLFPHLATLIAQRIQTAAIQNDPVKLYSALRIYLMLGNVRYLNQETLIAWINNNWKQNLKVNRSELAKLLQHLRFAIDANVLPITLNTSVLTTARSVLKQLQPVQLAATILRSQTVLQSKMSLDLTADKTVFKKPNISIPFLYTQTGFTQNVKPAINQVIDTVLTGNWIIGENHRNKISDPERNRLQELLTSLYFKRYIQVWNQAIQNIQFNKIVGTKQMVAMLSQMIQQQQLANLLQTITNNTNFLQQQNLQNAAAFTAIGKFTNAHLASLITDIKTLHGYLQLIVTASDPGQQAFKLAKQRMDSLSSTQDPITNLLTLAKQAPAPVNSWIKNIAENSWNVVLQRAHNYISAAWQTRVIAQYNAVINNRFPIYKNSAQDISLKNFSKFFAPHGVLQSFYLEFLSPFIDNTTAPWTLRVKNGVSLPILPSLLIQFERAALIQEMFFANGKTPNIQFVLTPIALKNNDQAVNLNMNGQQAFFQITSNKPRGFTWPGKGNNQQTILSFITNQGQRITESKTGQWSLFRLLNEAAIKQTKDTRQFELVFDYQGNAVKFKLDADNNINPFIPGIVDQFRCPVVI